MSLSILIIDDEATLAKNIKTYLSRYGYAARTATDADKGLQAIDTFKPDLVLLDYQLGDLDGLTVLRHIRERDSHIKIIMMTGHGNVEIAVNAMKVGAHDYLSKPLALDELKLAVDKISEQQRLEETVAYYHSKEAERGDFAKLLGESPPMQALKQKLQRFIDAEQRLGKETPPAVLITGETGTGKELVARAFHFSGQRHDKPFIEINCASIPAHLIEAELFGFERGAFTDAKERKPGLVETADGGTLFLDEIGELDLALQAKLLRLLEDKHVRRLGGLRDQQVDVRIVAATNQNLEHKVQRGEFRADLLFRLRIIQLELPPLRQRGDDILLLANTFLAYHSKRYGREHLQLSAAAKSRLCQYAWPGNVRELRNLIEQAVLLSDGTMIDVEHLPLNTAMLSQAENHANDTQDMNDLNLERIENRALTHALQKTNWNITHASRLLGISRDTLRYRMEKYGISPSAS